MKVVWFENWHPILDEALSGLPEIEACPHELFKLLLQNPGPTAKRAALVTERDKPVAIAGLRRKSRFSWEPVSQWILPGFIFPVQPGYLMRVFEALRKDIWVAWWRMDSKPQTGPSIRYFETTPTYRVHRPDDFEQFWRGSGHYKTVRRVRNHCKNFTLTINSPGSLEWVIQKWEERWRKNPAESGPELQDRIAAARYLTDHQRYYTLLLSDGDTPVGAATMSVHRNDLVAGVIYRQPEYEKQGIGTRLIDLCFTFFKDSNFDTLDLGGGGAYKKHWAPQEGEHCFLNICPEPIYRIKRINSWVRGLRAKPDVRAAVSPELG